MKQIKHNHIMALASVGMIFISGIAHLMKQWFPFFTSGFVSWMFGLGIAVGVYCIIWIVILGTRENWKSAFSRKSVKVKLNPEVADKSQNNSPATQP